MLGKENTGEQVVDNQSRLIRMQKEDTPLSSSQQILQLPEGFTIGKAIGEGDCFFDAIAQGLKQLKPGTNFTVKSLREVCRLFAEEQLDLGSSWLTEALKNEGIGIVYYISCISFTANDINKGSEVIDRLGLKGAMWGTPYIEGRILCTIYKVRLHLIEVYNISNRKNTIMHHIINSGGYKKVILDHEILNKKVYHRKDTIHIINKGRFHFEPVLRRTVQQMLPHCYDIMDSKKIGQ